MVERIQRVVTAVWAAPPSVVMGPKADVPPTVPAKVGDQVPTTVPASRSSIQGLMYLDGPCGCGGSLRLLTPGAEVLILRCECGRLLRAA